MKASKLTQIFVFILLASPVVKAGGDSLFTFLETKQSNKGKMYFYWGYNRGAYTDSDIKMEGRNFNYELFDVKAKDRQTKFDWNLYFHPENLTIPQTNMKFGYFFRDNYSFSIGVDHMKYVMVQDQTVKMTGTISDTGTEHDGTYQNDDKLLDQNFLIYEHTDGLNYLNIELNRFDGLVSYKNWLELQSIVGIGAGALMPKTNSVMFNGDRYDEFHLAGYGLNAKVGLNLSFGKYFFIQTEGKTGFIHMPDIRPTQFADEKASQYFFFGEYTMLAGVKFPINTKKD